MISSLNWINSIKNVKKSTPVTTVLCTIVMCNAYQSTVSKIICDVILLFRLVLQTDLSLCLSISSLPNHFLFSDNVTTILQTL